MHLCHSTRSTQSIFHEGLNTFLTHSSVSSSLGNKKKLLDKKGKGKEQGKEGLNVLSIVELAEVNMFSSQSINFPDM